MENIWIKIFHIEIFLIYIRSKFFQWKKNQSKIHLLNVFSESPIYFI